MGMDAALFDWNACLDIEKPRPPGRSGPDPPPSRGVRGSRRRQAGARRHFASRLVGLSVDEARKTANLNSYLIRQVSQHKQRFAWWRVPSTGLNPLNWEMFSPANMQQGACKRRPAPTDLAHPTTPALRLRVGPSHTARVSMPSFSGGIRTHLPVRTRRWPVYERVDSCRTPVSSAVSTGGRTPSCSRDTSVAPGRGTCPTSSSAACVRRQARLLRPANSIKIASEQHTAE